MSQIPEKFTLSQTEIITKFEEISEFIKSFKEQFLKASQKCLKKYSRNQNEFSISECQNSSEKIISQELKDLNKIVRLSQKTQNELDQFKNNLKQIKLQMPCSIKILQEDCENKTSVIIPKTELIDIDNDNEARIENEVDQQRKSMLNLHKIVKNITNNSIYTSITYYRLKNYRFFNISNALVQPSKSQNCCFCDKEGQNTEINQLGPLYEIYEEDISSNITNNLLAHQQCILWTTQTKLDPIKYAYFDLKDLIKTKIENQVIFNQFFFHKCYAKYAKKKEQLLDVMMDVQKIIIFHV